MIIKKSFKRFIAFIALLMVALFAVSVMAPVTASAATSAVQYYNILSSGYKYIYNYQDYNSYAFNLSQQSTIEIDLGSSTHGFFKLEIVDMDRKVVFTKSGYAYYDSFAYKKTLPQGAYKLYVYNNDYDETTLYYSVSVYRLYTPPKNPTSLKLNKKKLTLEKGTGSYLTATYKPTDVTSSLTWKSSKPNVATVSSSGYVYGNQLGKTTITAKMGNKKAKCTVYVKSTYYEIGKGKSASLKSYVKNISGYKKAKWSSGKSSVVSVSKSGKIKAKKHGNVKITAKIKGIKYSILVYSYDKKKLKKETVSNIKDGLYVPSSFRINTVKYVDFKTVKIYYSAYTRDGQRIYSCATGYYTKGVFSWYKNF